MPLWKLKLTEEEYTNLKETLVQNAYRLEDFGIEAALCYAEWWRRDYNGGIPSREDVAVGLGLPHYCWEQLYKAARHGLKSHGFAFIHSLKGNEYFRTLLNQGGLPVNYIKNGTNLSGFSRFLIGLVEELSSINIDWDDNNIDLIKNFNCIAYLGKAFKNDNIYDVSLQIAHAIISEEDRWLPYDDTDSSLSELTKSLKREYRRVKSEHRTKPLSLSWKLRLTSSKTANLFVNLNIVKEISSKSIEGLNYQSCYTFDVFVSGILVGKYVRKSLVKDDKGEVIGAIYSRITVGVANDIKWSGEPVVEVKIRCDNDDRLFPTLCGSYPPNFECPQVFQMLDDNVYSLKSTANAENNIAVFSTNWKCDGSHNLLLNGELYSAIKFTDKVDLHNCMSNEDITITNEFTPYSAEFRGTYIQWVEQSNFKLLTRIPVISVFDQTGTRVGNIKPKYRVHNSKAEWRNLSNSCLLPFGLVDIKVEFLRQNVLEATDVENQGYMLDLMGDKVKLQLIEKGYLCPVDNVIIDAPFCGYSPRMNGYIGRENFDRFKIKTEFVNPLFPFKSADQTEKNVMEWIEKNFFEQKAAGVFGVMNSRVFASKPIFISAEHSAQQSSEDLDRYEREFNEGKINILSCSTTMEMGVDIGGITEVVMNNVPPKSSNYLQRTGRAGRRNETKALALTVCAPNPIGTHTWNNPDYPITHVTETPLLKLESRQLIQRHVNAMVFASFVADQGGIRVTATLRDFFVTAEGMSFFDKFLNYIDSVISGKVERLQEPYSKLIKGTSLAQITLADAAQVVKKDIVAVYNVFDAHKGALAKAIESLKNESGTTNAIKAIEKQEENLLKTSMLSYLAENSFLPSAGLPLGLVECLLGGKEKVDGNSPTLHISQAISSYAPGNPVVKNEWVYEPNGIRLKTKYDDSTSRYIIQNCTHCGYTTIIYGSAKTDCPKCGRHGTMHGIKDISLSTDQRFTEVVEPAAFSVAWDSTPTRKMDSLGSMNFIQPILLEMDAWLLKTNSAKMSIRCSTPRSEILFYNKGTSGYGYAFCPYCGRMKSEKSPDSTERMLSHHKHLLASTSCPGGENDGAAVRRHVLLVGRYQTDFVEIKFYDKDNNLVEDTETLYSLGVILSRKLTELLGVNDGEIEFGYDGINHSIFIYDTALGGAGYSLLFREYKDEVLKMALETLERCDCERSCTKCLIDRRSQWYTNYLNRPKALEWLRQEVKARVAPKEIIYLMPDSHAVTSDITTEFYQLTRNKDISGIRIFVDDNISQWDAETFPFIKILTELSLEGVDVAFILPSVPDVKSLSSADSATLIAEVFKTNFKCLENTLPTGLFPLMVVIMNDGIVKTYFGKNIDTSYSKNWGSGDVFITTQPNSLSYADINRMQLLSAFSSDDSSFMFEYRIREHSSLGRFFDSLKAPETGNWNRIISNLRGKAVSIEYSDRYLKTPLGCMLLAKMISSLKNEADLVLVSIKVIVTNIVSINDSDVAVNAIKDFANGKKRNHFLKDAIFELTGIEPEIQDTGYVEHERCLTVKADNAEVCIRPDAGIAKGWAPFGRDNAECTDRDFREDWNIDLELFNKQQIGNGILYTISYKQL